MQSVLQHAIDAIHVRFGHQALVRATRLPDVQRWPTGLSAVDRLSGICGLARGRISVLQGPPGSGKLSLGLDLLARASRGFSRAVVLDLGRGFDPWILQPRDPDLTTLAVIRPPNPSAAGEAAVALARAGAGFLLLLDPLPEYAMASLESAAAHSSCVLVAIDEGGDRALAHASSLTLVSHRICWVWERILVGLQARLACLKNKLAAPGSEAELEVRYAVGATVFTAEPVREVSDGHGSPPPSTTSLPSQRAAAIRSRNRQAVSGCGSTTATAGKATPTVDGGTVAYTSINANASEFRRLRGCQARVMKLCTTGRTRPNFGLPPAPHSADAEPRPRPL